MVKQNILLQRMVCIYCLKYNEETILIIINKNSSSYKLDLKKFSELNLNGKTLKNIISEEIIEWNDDLILNNQGVVILTTTL